MHSNGSSHPLLVEYRMVQPLWKIVWQFLIKLNIYLKLIFNFNKVKYILWPSRVSTMAQWAKDLTVASLVAAETWVQSPAQCSGLRISSCHSCGVRQLWLRFNPEPGNFKIPRAKNKQTNNQPTYDLAIPLPRVEFILENEILCSNKITLEKWNSVFKQNLYKCLCQFYW